MQSQMRAAGVNLQEVHGAEKTIVTNMPIEKQKCQIQQVDKNRPKLGRGRAEMQCKHPYPVADTWVPVLNQLITNKTETITKRQVQDKNRE